MFRRAFWFTAGAAAGVWATNKVNRKLRQLTPESLAAQAADKAVEAGHRLKDFALDVRAGMLQREAELEEALGLDAPVDPALPGPRRTALGPGGPAAAPVRRAHPHPHPTHPYNRNEDH
ncbi:MULTISPECIES: hypothetical protein [unclassified Streptomyces]|uniref:hypothetical protein n=1 Tax=unclassified Streptomyces TaxID=2593676 RepID=UPI0033DF5D8D